MRLLSLLAGLLLAAPALASPQTALAAACSDCRKLPPAIAYQTLYLDLSPLPADYRAEAARVIDWHVNQLSRGSERVKARRVSDELLAVVLADYGWSRQTRENLAVVDPYFHAIVLWPGGTWPRDGKYYAAGSFKYAVPGFWLDQQQAAELQRLTNSAAPLVRADWFFVVSSRQLSLDNKDDSGIGYYDWLGIKNRKDFEKLVRLNNDDSVAVGKEMMAALERSGIAINNRQILRLQSVAGAAWRTFDSDSDKDKSNAIRLLKRGDFKHRAERHFAALGNGLFAMLLCDAEGKLQAEAPSFVGQHRGIHQQGTDARIHVGRCWECHTQGLHDIDDWARRNLKSPLSLNVTNPDDIQLFRRQYFSKLAEQVEKDNAAYKEALREVTGGWTPTEAARAYAKLYYHYLTRDRTLYDVAAEMGLHPGSLVKALRAEASPPPAGKGFVDTVLSPWTDNPANRVRVEMVEELMPELWRIVLKK